MEYTIEGSFAIEATVPGAVPYSGFKSRASLAIGEIVEAATEEEARDLALQLVAKVTEDVKLHLAANTPGIEYSVDEHGIGQLAITDIPVRLTSEGAPSASAPKTGGGGQTGGSRGYTPKDHGGNRYTIMWNGEFATLFDNRETKNPGGPDFRVTFRDEDKEDLAFWEFTKSGAVNKGFTALAKMVEEAVPAA